MLMLAAHSFNHAVFHLAESGSTKLGSKFWVPGASDVTFWALRAAADYIVNNPDSIDVNYLHLTHEFLAVRNPTQNSVVVAFCRIHMYLRCREDFT